jgi:cytochrome b561
VISGRPLIESSYYHSISESLSILWMVVLVWSSSDLKLKEDSPWRKFWYSLRYLTVYSSYLILTTAGFFRTSYSFSKFMYFDNIIFPFSDCLYIQ